MTITARVGALFFVISLAFLLASLVDRVKQGRTMTSARRVWLRMALIFAIVGTCLFILPGHW